MSDKDSNTHSDADGEATSQALGEGAKPNSIDTARIVADVVKQLMPEIQKATQSQKDRRFAEIEQTQKMVMDKLGITPEKAKDIGLFSQTEAKTESVADQPSGKVEDSGAIADKVLEASGIRLDDPNVLAYKQQTFASEQERVVAVAGLVAKMANPKPASPAATPPPNAPSKPSPNQEGVINQLEELWKHPVENAEAIRKATGELDSL